jgi:hypothetical protein
MKKVIRGYAKDKNLNLVLIGTIPVPHSKDKRSPAARQDKRYLVRQGTIFKKEISGLIPTQTDARLSQHGSEAAIGFSH